jgi:hypothetical protein
MKIVNRFIGILIGLILIVAGAGIIFAFCKLKEQQSSGDIWDNGFLLIDEAYSIIGSLFCLLGLRYILGQRKIIEQKIASSLRHFATTVFPLSLAVLAAVIYSTR